MKRWKGCGAGFGLDEKRRVKDRGVVARGGERRADVGDDFFIGHESFRPVVLFVVVYEEMNVGGLTGWFVGWLCF